MSKKIDFIIIGLYGGGAERVMVLIADYLVKKNYDISIISFCEAEAWDVNPKIKRVRLHNREKIIRNNTLRCIYNLSNYYRKRSNRPDLVISFTTTINMISILVSKLFGLKIIVSEHNNYLRNLSKKSKYIKEYVYKYANVLTVLTSYDIDYYKRHKANVMIMANPCSFKPIDNMEIERDKTLLVVGSLDRYHHKGFDNLIEIVKPILKENVDWNLKIVGGGNNKVIKDLVAVAGISKQVEFTGRTTKVLELMQQSDIFILSSRFEGLPMVLLEAMSQGMTCISYDCITGPSDIINDGVDGLLIEDQNIKMMQTGLRKLIGNEVLRNQFRQEAIKIADRYSIELIGKKWEEIISETTVE